MKLIEKLKNTFFEEEYVEVEKPEVKKQEVAKKVEPKEIIKQEVQVKPVEEKVMEPIIEEKRTENYSDKELSRKDTKLPYFEDEDFVDEDIVFKKDLESKKVYGESEDKLYDSIQYSNKTSNKLYSAPLKESFKPTPIISPIYGILDKNYKKEEVVDKKDKVHGVSSYVSRKNADLDSVRKKAYGGLDPFMETLESVPVTSNEEEQEEEVSLLYDMTVDHSKPMVDQVTIADAEEYFEDLGLEYNVDYKDTRYEKATGRRVSHRFEIKDDSNEKEETNLEDNLFEVIDSIYEEGED